MFGVTLGEKILRLSDNLSCTLQQKDLSAAEGNRAACLKCETLISLRKDAEFVIIWEEMIKNQKEFDLEEPALPRR